MCVCVGWGGRLIMLVNCYRLVGSLKDPHQCSEKPRDTENSSFTYSMLYVANTSQPHKSLHNQLYHTQNPSIPIKQNTLISPAPSSHICSSSIWLRRPQRREEKKSQRRWGGAWQNQAKPNVMCWSLQSSHQRLQGAQLSLLCIPLLQTGDYAFWPVMFRL